MNVATQAVPLSTPEPFIQFDFKNKISRSDAPRPVVASAIVYCEANFGDIDGKTANGLIRRSEKYDIISVIDSKKAGLDSGMVLDKNRCKPANIEGLSDLEAWTVCSSRFAATMLVFAQRAGH